MIRKFYLLATVSVCLWAAGTEEAKADWSFFETFDAMAVGSDLNGQNGWVADDDNSAEETRQIIVDPADAENNALDIYSGGGSDVYNSISVDATSSGTIYARFYVPAVGTESNPNAPDFQLAAATVTGGALSAGGAGPHIRVDEAGGSYNLQIRNGGAFSTLTTLATDTWYQVWIPFSNDTDTHEVYLQGGAFASQTQMMETDNNTTFNFRTTNSDPLVSIYARLNSGHESDNIFVDDIFVDETSVNLAVPVVPLLRAFINPATGEIQLKNILDSSLEFDAYQFVSPLDGLKPGNSDWNSLSDQDYDAIGSNPGESWDESGGSGTGILSERFLLGETTLDPGESVSLGMAYDTTIADSGLTMIYNDSETSSLQPGLIEFIIPGDMDGNGVLEDADVNPFVEALTNRASYETNNPGVDADFYGDFNGNGKLDLGDVALFKAAILALPGTSSASAVPEPSSMALFGLAAIALAIRRRR